MKRSGRNIKIRENRGDGGKTSDVSCLANIITQLNLFDLLVWGFKRGYPN